MKAVIMHKIGIDMNFARVLITDSTLTTKNFIRGFKLKNLTISNSKFIENPSNVLSLNNSINIIIQNCKFFNNSQISLIQNTFTSIIGTSFENNHCQGNGCALFVENSKVNIKNCNFTNNINSNFGGAIFINSNIENQVEIEAVFSKNKAKFGGAVYVQNYKPLINPKTKYLTKNDNIFSKPAYITNGTINFDFKNVY